MHDKCQSIRIDIELLQQSITATQAELSTAVGAHKYYLISIIKENQEELSQLTAALTACEAQPAPEQPPLVGPQVFGSEITQGLPGYELVAGKDTLARVFLGGKRPVFAPYSSTKSQTSGLEDLHFDLPIYGEANLDFAVLHVTGPDGIAFEVPGQMATGSFANQTQQNSEHDNVNFYIDGKQLHRVGDYDFNASFYRHGLFVGGLPLGHRTILPTKDLRVLIVVDGGPDGIWVMPNEAWSTLFEVLPYVNRNLPLRTGIGPMNGASTVGLRYAIDPTPMNPDFPDWGPMRARLADFNTQQANEGKLDRADLILSVRIQQPFEGTLGGVAIGQVAGVTLNVSPASDHLFGTLIAHELGHILGIDHSGSPVFDAPTAFDLLNRRAISDPRSVMFGNYGGNTNENSLLLPVEWNRARQSLLTLDSTGPE